MPLATAPPLAPSDQLASAAVPEAVGSQSVDARLRQALERHFGLIWRTLRGLGVSAPSADDAAQHVFTIFSERLRAIELGRERAFLVATAIRVAANERRLTARRPEDATDRCDDLSDPGPDPEQLTASNQARQILEQILLMMPTEQRAVFVLFELEGLTLTEVAATLEIPRGTVASRLRAARAVFEAESQRHRDQEPIRGGTR